MLHPGIGGDFGLLLNAGHGEYMPPETIMRWSPYDQLDCIPEDEYPVDEGLWLEKAFEENYPGLKARMPEYDPTWQILVLMPGPLEMHKRQFNQLAEQLAGGPEGGDDNVADYYPSGLRMLRDFAIDLQHLGDLEATERYNSIRAEALETIENGHHAWDCYQEFEEPLEILTFECDSCKQDKPIGQLVHSISRDIKVFGQPGLQGVDLTFCQDCMDGKEPTDG